MSCPECGNKLYRVYAPLKSKYVMLKNRLYCKKCDKVFKVKFEEENPHGDVERNEVSSK